MSNLTLAYLLIVVGLLLLVAELFIPSAGLLLVLAVVALVAGVAMTFIYGNDPYTGVVTLFGVFIAIPIVVSVALHYWPKTRWGKRFQLNPPEDDATVANMPVHLELEALRGRHGRTVSALRPSGVTEFDGRQVDTISEGMMIEPGEWVKCIDVRAGKVIVRRVDKPDLGELENITF
jgi:membrane-bound serine protease (ClpP class)